MLLYVLSIIGLCLFALLFFIPDDGNKRAAEAIGLAGAACIAGALAIYVGDRTDANTTAVTEAFSESSKANGRAEVENARTVGINNILVQVENVVDTHQGTRPCIRYILGAELVSNLVDNKVPDGSSDATPDISKMRADCLGPLYIKQPSLIGQSAPATEWGYMRGEIISYLNALELAAIYSHPEPPLNHPLKHEEVDNLKFPLSGQDMLFRLLDGMLRDPEGFAIMEKWLEYDHTKEDMKTKSARVFGSFAAP